MCMMADGRVESGNYGLPPTPSPPGLQQCYHHHKCEIDSFCEPKIDLTVVKFVIGMMLIVMQKYWFTSLLVFFVILFSYFLYSSILAFLIILSSCVAIFYQISDQLVFWPTFPSDSRAVVRLPSSVGLPSENLYLYAKDGTKLHAVFIKQNQHNMKSVPTLIYFHGNAGNLGHRLSNVYGMYRSLGVNILMVEYRGYGLSEGMPSENGLYMDGQSAVAYLKTRADVDQNKIVIFGRSLGGAVAVDCVSRAEISSRVAAVILENTFTSIPDMAQFLFHNVRGLRRLPTWCHKNKFNSKLKMCRIVVPTLLLSGQADTLVPPSMMLELYQACASSQKRLFQFRRGSHNETWKCPGYHQALSHFLDEIFSFKSSTPIYPPGVVCISGPVVL